MITDILIDPARYLLGIAFATGAGFVGGLVVMWWWLTQGPSES